MCVIFYNVFHEFHRDTAKLHAILNVLSSLVPSPSPYQPDERSKRVKFPAQYHLMTSRTWARAK